MTKKIYAVAIGRRTGIFESWGDCKRSIHKYPNARFKGFSSLEEAEEYLAKHQINPKSKKGSYIPAKKPTKLCVLCERPTKKKGELCAVCATKRRKLCGFLQFMYRFDGISIDSLVYLKQKYKQTDIFEFLNQNPSLAFVCKETNKYEKRKIKNEIKTENSVRLQKRLEKSTSDIPAYIMNFMQEEKDKELLWLEGDRMNPFIYFRCKRCKCEIKMYFSDLQKHLGHGCLATKSSGEAIIEKYLLQQHITYVTQRKTLRCINPKTHRQLPYDFQLPLHKVIIEVQGEQHNNFVEIFHGTYENF